MLSDADREAFDEAGYVRLPGAVPPDDAKRMHHRLWELLERQGVRRDDPLTWPPGFASALQAVREEDPDPRRAEPLREALDGLFGVGQWRTTPNWGQALVTFPQPGPWELPRQLWHLDHPYVQPGPVSGVTAFLFVDDVGPRGGGTLVVRSSPAVVRGWIARLPNAAAETHSTHNKRLIHSHPWWRELAGRSAVRTDRIDRFMRTESDVDGTRVRIVELTGAAGDVVLCHPLLVHAPSSNASDRPRFMRAVRVYRAGIRTRGSSSVEREPQTGDGSGVDRME